MLNVVLLKCYAEYRNFECSYVECRYAQRHYVRCHYAECCVFLKSNLECHYAECRVLKCNAEVIMVSVVMMSAIMLNDIMLSVMAPKMPTYQKLALNYLVDEMIRF
jgi:hypothetical protein